MLAELLSVVAPVMVVALVGFAWGHAGARFDSETVSRLVLEVGAPCLIFHSLTATNVDPRALATMAGMAVVALLAFAVVGGLALRALGMPARTFLGALVFVNAGNFGLPLCLFAFGEEGLALGVAFFTVSFAIHAALGPAIVGGDRSSAWARSPMLWAVLVATVVAGLGLPVPLWVERSTEILGALVIPMMLLTLGVSLSRLRSADLGRGAVLAGLRAALGAGVGFALAALFHLEGAERGVFVLECATPIGVFNFMLAERYAREPEAVAGAVLMSTVASFATMPAILAVL